MAPSPSATRRLLPILRAQWRSTLAFHGRRTAGAQAFHSYGRPVELRHAGGSPRRFSTSPGTCVDSGNSALRARQTAPQGPGRVARRKFTQPRSYSLIKVYAFRRSCAPPHRWVPRRQSRSNHARPPAGCREFRRSGNISKTPPISRTLMHRIFTIAALLFAPTRARGTRCQRGLDPGHAGGRGARQRRPACAATDPTGIARRSSYRDQATEHLATYSQSGNVPRPVQSLTRRYDRIVDVPRQYGWLGIDITARLLEHATETAYGLSAKNVDLPFGDHTITVSIADSNGRTGSRKSCVCQTQDSRPPSRRRTLERSVQTTCRDPRFTRPIPPAPEWQAQDAWCE